MALRRRIIQGGYIWEVTFIWDVIMRDPDGKTRFTELFEAYAAYSDSARWTPVTPTVFSSVLRREALKMANVLPVGNQRVVWYGLTVSSDSAEAS
jgi:hypothetical protein